MSSIAITGGATGTGVFSLLAPSTNTNRTLTLPDVTGTVALQGGSGVGKVLQVVSTTKVDTFSMSSSSFVEITGLTAVITPTSTSSKIMVSVSLGRVSINTGVGKTVGFRLMRGATAVGIGTISGSQLATSFVVTSDSNTNYSSGGFNFQFLDSPSSTSSNTYSIQMYPESGAAAYINRSYAGGTGGTIYESASASTITVMEIAA